VADAEGRRRASQFDVRRLGRDLARKLEEWRFLLRRHVAQARQVVRNVLDERVVLTPSGTGSRPTTSTASPCESTSFSAVWAFH